MKQKVLFNKDVTFDELLTAENWSASGVDLGFYMSDFH